MATEFKILEGSCATTSAFKADEPSSLFLKLSRLRDSVIPLSPLPALLSQIGREDQVDSLPPAGAGVQRMPIPVPDASWLSCRFAKLLLRLPALRSIGLKCLEHLFFFKLIGDTPIDTFLMEMLETPLQIT